MCYLERLKELRESREIKQQVVAKHLNIAQNTYSQYENGKRDMPISMLIKICKYYDISADYVLGLTDKKKSLDK